jgi:hypothetical protein
VTLRFDEFMVNARYWCSEVEIAVILLKTQTEHWIYRRDAKNAKRFGIPIRGMAGSLRD